MKNVLMLYLPVLHQGYIELFRRCAKKTHTLYIFAADILVQFGYQGREIRAIDPDTMVGLADQLRIFRRVDLLNRNATKKIKKGTTIITVDEEISHQVINHYFPSNPVTYENWFLRWDEKKVFSQTVPSCKVSRRASDRKIMREAKEAGQRSPDWWRQVGAVLKLDNDSGVSEYNRHLPTDATPYINGDPRDFIPAGEDSDLSSAIHAEQKIIAWAAREGIRLTGTILYVTVFPCPVCAKLIAVSGIKKLYFASGHSSLDGLAILQAAGVELIQVK